MNKQPNQELSDFHKLSQQVIDKVGELSDLDKNLDSLTEKLDVRPFIGATALKIRELTQDRSLHLLIEVEQELPKVQADSLRLYYFFDSFIHISTKLIEKGYIALRAFARDDKIHFEMEAQTNALDMDKKTKAMSWPHLHKIIDLPNTQVNLYDNASGSKIVISLPTIEGLC